MRSQKCKITALAMALIFAVFACPFAIQAKVGNIDSNVYGTEGMADTVDPGDGTETEEPPPPTIPPEEPTPEPPGESSYVEEPDPEPTIAPTVEPDPTYAPTQEPEWTPAPTQAPNYDAGTTATATPRPTTSPSSSAGITRPTATLRPNAGNTETSASQQKESNYVTFATMNVRQNSFATSLFYGGVACIFLGSVGIVVLIVLFIKNRRSKQNDRDGIFEEIEQAEIRGKAAQDSQAAGNTRPPQAQQQTGQASVPRAPVKQSERKLSGREQPSPRANAGTGDQSAIKPANISMYTEEIHIPAPKEATPQPPSSRRTAPAKEPQTGASGEKHFDTEEILREALYQDDDL